MLDELGRRYLTEIAQRLVRISTAVPLGFETLLEPDDPRLVGYVQGALRPELLALDVDLLDVPPNNLVARLGSGVSGRSLLIQSYPVTQHHHEMPDPFSGRLESGRLHGQGVTQSKAHQAVMLAVLRELRGHRLRGRLWWALNCEGRSSHARSEAILDAIGAPAPEFCIIQVGTGLAVSVGNRGRVDVDVVVEGSSEHSSVTGHPSVIAAAAEVVGRVEALRWEGSHPLLGQRHAVVYKIRYTPVAPHTLPARAELTVDRRLLPGDSPEAATAELAAAIGELPPFRVSVKQGVCMLPALVDEKLPWVRALGDVHAAVAGTQIELLHGQGSFDAGGVCARGVPAIMYGSGGRGLTVTGPDWIEVAEMEREAEVLLRLILRELG